MHDAVRLNLLHQRKHGIRVADVQIADGAARVIELFLRQLRRIDSGAVFLCERIDQMLPDKACRADDQCVHAVPSGNSTFSVCAMTFCRS